tara:strand:- start:397 stop:1080 length:684 start_codon:yes stop_codon:yes gene_type:complete
MKNIVILAAGPQKENRTRHLEIKRDKIIIDNIISECQIKDTKISIIISSRDYNLKKHLSYFHPLIDIIFPEDDKIINTFRAALSISGDCILIAGDLLNLKCNDIKKFIETKYKAAACYYKIPWGENVKAKYSNLIRRGDVGDCILFICDEYKENFLSNDNYEKALKLFKEFCPNGRGVESINEYIYNDIGTFMSFAFFKKLWSTPGLNINKDKGLIYFDRRIYLDND